MRSLVILSALAAGVPAATAQGVEVPSPPATTPAPAAAPAPTAAQPAVGTAPATPPAASPTAPSVTVALVLRTGDRGAYVRDLQRELRRRGLRIVVDGSFGPATRAAVTRIQKRFGMKPTGVADTRLLRKLGLRTRVAAAAPVTRTVVAPGTSGLLDTFPLVGDTTYSDDFGAARHQGRHEGTDLMADRGTPIVAVTSGTIDRLTRTETGLGGIYIWLRRADGTEYYYAHMNAIAEGLTDGSAVTAGQVIGSVGNSGDARYGATHLHFEIRRAGSTPTNPYPHLVAVDPTTRAQARR